eukprot:Protomagalhaensia_sp_Gyna_25__4355@NODE_3988_length_380_cov_51_420048_g3421_i0_p1_GENE_NODE_3988_length_380_cov_51_420048_g3421_i0NODE_3988_length_380_cov_51_420048_g3421_i0_p1_ORF_typecomplete_len122_score26_28Prefoldin_2/PF01920_20/5_9e20Prefoldin/PF02996_17/0_51Prefoldin/PF02996_17/0_02DUF615/PF04751_14/0_00036DivIVA/PF05103_13/0_0012SlyX/PF04102_12/0_66SlyX/PF04102_12/0_064CLZ/PF16526_5/27CLZ/PF16526_5/0_017HAP1_N/PF04849_13/0_0017CAGE1/PF15066_6/1_4CAGE1/PF15066_6/0_062Spc7/PF08317_11/0_28S
MAATPSLQVLTQRIKELETQQVALTQKIAELSHDQREATLVVDALKTADKSRRCYRLVGGVLVERTVGEVETALQAQQKNIDEIVKKLEAHVEKLNKEHAELIRGVRSG